jgi:hypothetical protein
MAISGPAMAAPGEWRVIRSIGSPGGELSRRRRDLNHHGAESAVSVRAWPALPMVPVHPLRPPGAPDVQRIHPPLAPGAVWNRTPGSAGRPSSDDLRQRGVRSVRAGTGPHPGRGPADLLADPQLRHDLHPRHDNGGSRLGVPGASGVARGESAVDLDPGRATAGAGTAAVGRHVHRAAGVRRDRAGDRGRRFRGRPGVPPRDHRRGTRRPDRGDHPELPQRPPPHRRRRRAEDRRPAARRPGPEAAAGEQFRRRLLRQPGARRRGDGGRVGAAPDRSARGSGRRRREPVHGVEGPHPHRRGFARRSRGMRHAALVRGEHPAVRCVRVGRQRQLRHDRDGEPVRIATAPVRHPGRRVLPSDRSVLVSRRRRALSRDPPVPTGLRRAVRPSPAEGESCRTHLVCPTHLLPFAARGGTGSW